jgi:hypothetical protein
MFYFDSLDSGHSALSLVHGEDYSVGDPKASTSVIAQHEQKLDNDGEITAKLLSAADNPQVVIALAGYKADPEAALQASCASKVNNTESASSIVPEYLKEFIHIETIYAGMLRHNVVRDLAKANAVMGTENLDMVKVCFFPCTFAGCLFVSYTDWPPRDLDAIFALPLMWVVRLILQADGD